MSREKAESLVRKRANAASSQTPSIFDTHPKTNTRSCGPVPKTWYAMLTPPLEAYRVSGRIAQPLAQMSDCLKIRTSLHKSSTRGARYTSADANIPPKHPPRVHQKQYA